jgi:hypothetical protein
MLYTLPRRFAVLKPHNSRLATRLEACVLPPRVQLSFPGAVCSDKSLSPEERLRMVIAGLQTDPGCALPCVHVRAEATA